MFQLAQHSFVRLQSFRRRFGWRATLARIAQELRGQPRPAAPSQPQPAAPPAPGTWAAVPPADSTRPASLRFYLTPRHHRQRVTLIGEQFRLRQPGDAGATALILATALANRLGADLRIVARLQGPQPDDLDPLLQRHGLALEGESIFLRAPASGPDVELDRFDDELMLVTSWQSASAALALVPAHQVVYLVQADERLLLPHGPERAACEALLQRQDLRFVVHTRQLFDHLVAQGLPHFQHCAVSFEPAFPVQPARRATATGERRRFVFHATTTVDRDLFRLGLATIEKALQQGVLDLKRWELLFVGRDLPQVALAGGQRPRYIDDLGAGDGLAVLHSADLGLSLSPRGLPSRLPLEMAAGGAVVVVNADDPKAAGPAPGDNGLVVCRAEVDALLQGLQAALGLATPSAQRHAPHAQPAWPRQWARTLQGTIDHLAAAR